MPQLDGAIPGDAIEYLVKDGKENIIGK